MNEKTLDIMTPVKLRDQWLNEPNDFTPWLAQESDGTWPNLDLLAQSLGFGNGAFELKGCEFPVEDGQYKADILCERKDGSRVVIENQLEDTDHKHLGQLITYGAGLSGKARVNTLIWIAKKFQPAHRAALDFLNTQTQEHINFFGVEIELWTIGNSLPAPRFNVVVQPNNWLKKLERSTKEHITKQTAEQFYIKYWEAYNSYVESQNSSGPHSSKSFLHRIGKNFSGSHTDNSLPHSTGKTGFRIYLVCVKSKKLLKVELVMKDDNARNYFDLLSDNETDIEEQLGTPCEWVEEAGEHESKIRIKKEFPNNAFDLDMSEDMYKELIEWHYTWHRQFDKVFVDSELINEVFEEIKRIKNLNLADHVPDIVNE